jgi:hypothetical protein
MKPSILRRPLRRTWTWPAAAVAIAALGGLALAVATGRLPLDQALSLAVALVGGG